MEVIMKIKVDVLLYVEGISFGLGKRKAYSKIIEKVINEEDLATMINSRTLFIEPFGHCMIRSVRVTADGNIIEVSTFDENLSEAFLQSTGWKLV